MTLEVECSDRMYLNLNVPRLQHDTGVIGFFKGHRGASFASSALMDPMTIDFVRDVETFVSDQGTDLVTFENSQRRDEVPLAYLAEFDADEGVLFDSKAQDHSTANRTEKHRNPERTSPTRGSCGRGCSSTTTTSTVWTKTSGPSS